MNYRLYRNFYDIIHPSISRKNISNYEIILDEEIVPAIIFYPGRDVIIKNIIIYIPGKIENYDVYKNLAMETDNLILVIKYNESNKFEDCYNFIKYIYDNIKNVEMTNSNITLMSDNNGGDLETKILDEAISKNSFDIKKMVLIAPCRKVDCSKNMLVITGVDSKFDSNEYKKIQSYIEGFIKGDNLAACEHVYSLVKKFIN